MNFKKKPHIEALIIARGRELTSNKEIAAVTGRSVRYWQMIFAGDSDDCTADELRKLSRFYSDRGENFLAEIMLSPEYAICAIQSAEADGVVDDEITDMVQIMGEIKTAHSRRDRNEIKNLMESMRDVLNRFNAEADRL